MLSFVERKGDSWERQLPLTDTVTQAPFSNVNFHSGNISLENGRKEAGEGGFPSQSFHRKKKTLNFSIVGGGNIDLLRSHEKLIINSLPIPQNESVTHVNLSDRYHGYLVQITKIV